MNSRARRLLFGVLTFVFGLCLAVSTGETVLRIIYRDGGQATYHAPGGRRFRYSFNGKFPLRSPDQAKGPKDPKVTRIMIVGDSITWGAGVHLWQALYPMQLLNRLNRKRKQYELAVFAGTAKEIGHHVETTAKVIDEISPDIVIYQWFVNDLELNKDRRPVADALWWRRWRFHPTLRARSYLYYFVDDRLGRIVPPPDRTYEQYLRDDYAQGTPGWVAFQREFDKWANLATGHAARTILMTYPVLVAGGSDPMREIRERVIRLAESYGMEIVDPTPYLKNFNTHVSLFDAHPNAHAHAVMADLLYCQIARKGDGCTIDRPVSTRARPRAQGQ